MRQEIKNLNKAAERIKKAIRKGERIILYGDADMDGVSSVIILKEAIRNLGGGISAIYFPDRESEGYGINEDALRYLKKYAKALFITVDLGIGNFKEVKMAKKIGFEVMLVDHHEVLKKLPDAKIIVNPKQRSDKYPFKEFAAAGVVFRLAEALLEKKLTPFLKDNFLELAALATIADMMPQEADNLEFLTHGLASLKNTFRPGLRALMQAGDEGGGQSSRQLAQRIISACHAGATKDHLNEAYLLLSSSSVQEADPLVRELIERASLRREEIQEVTLQVEERITKKSKEPIIFEGDKSWPILIAGPVASKICNVHKKPVFLYSQKEEDSQGAVRTPEGVDGVKSMTKCSKFLGTYGGHPQAAGFRVKNENLENFKDCLTKYFRELE